MAKRKAPVAEVTAAGQPEESLPRPPPAAKRQRTAGNGPRRRSGRLMGLPPPEIGHVNREITHINLLPTELLVSIFKEAQELLEDSYSPLGPPLGSVCVLGHVCRRWRDIMINCPPQLMLTSVFDDRGTVNPQSTGPEITTMTPEAVGEISKEYKIKLLALSVLAGDSRDVFRFNSGHRRKKRVELEIRDLCILGLNHHSAEFILTAKFNGLQSITIMHTEISRICQIASITKTPISCEKLIIKSVPFKGHSFYASTEEMRILRRRFYTQDICVEVKSDPGGMPDQHITTRQICYPEDFQVRKFKTFPPPLEKLKLSGISTFDIIELGLDIHDLRDLSVNITKFIRVKRRWHGSQEVKFWSGLLRAEKTLERVSIGGLARVEDIMDLPEALGKLSPECELTFDKTMPRRVLRELRRKIYTMDFMRVHGLWE